MLFTITSSKWQYLLLSDMGRQCSPLGPSLSGLPMSYSVILVLVIDIVKSAIVRTLSTLISAFMILVVSLHVAAGWFI